MTLLLNKFARPWFILCVKKRVKKKHCCQQNAFFATNAPSEGAHAQYYQTIFVVKTHLAHLQHSKSLEKYENKKVFELNV